MKLAESNTAALEALPFGEPWAELETAAKSAIAAERDRAMLVVFPRTIARASLTALGWYQFLIGRRSALDFPRIAEDHERALTDNPELAGLLRSPEALDDVGESAKIHASALTNDETQLFARQRAASLAVAKYKRTICAQLVTLEGELGDAARDLIACDALDARIAAARQRLEREAVAEVARVEAEQEAAERAVTAEFARRVAEATAAASSAAAAATRAQDEIRTARANAIRVELQRRLAKSTSPDRLGLHVDGSGRRIVDALVRELDTIAQSNSQLAAVEAAIASGAWSVV